MTPRPAPMHPLFADWYRSVDLDPDVTTLEKRWDTVVSVADDTPLLRAVDLAAFYLDAPGATAGSEHVVELAKAADSSFPLLDNASLVKAIAAGVLVHLMGLDWMAGDVTALALVSGHANGVGRSGPFPGLLVEAQKTLDRRSRAVRQVDLSSLVTTKKKSPFVDPTASLKPLGGDTTTETLATLSAATRARDVELRKAITDVNENARKGVSSLTNRLRALELAIGGTSLQSLNEETSLLWWLFGGYSDALDASLPDLDVPVRVLVAGREIAERTQFTTAHPAATALLLRAIEPADGGAELGLLQAARHAPGDWVAGWISEMPSVLLGLAPIHAAVWFCSQYGEEEQERQFVQKTGLDVATEMTPRDLALQTLNEALLLRAIS